MQMYRVVRKTKIRCLTKVGKQQFQIHNNQSAFQTGDFSQWLTPFLALATHYAETPIDKKLK